MGPKPALGWARSASLTGLMLISVLGHADASAQAVETAAAPLQFERTLRLEETSETSANVSLGDVDGDGDLDAVLAKGRHWPLVDVVLLGDGSGAFLDPRALGVADRTYSAVLVDLDADGDLDVVISNDDPDPKLIYLNDGNGNYTVGSEFGKPEWAIRHASVADMNGDGLPDIVLAHRTGDSSGHNYVCLNRGGGRFDDDCIGFSTESATTVTPADFNGDGLLDLVVPHREGGQGHIYLNSGDADFPDRIPFGPPDAAIRAAKAADLDGDEILDLVVIDQAEGAAILMGRPDGTFSSGVPLAESQARPYALALADLNDDGHVDVIVGHVNARPVAYFNDGRGTSFTPVPFGDEDGTAYGFAVGDVDDDGFVDIAVARSGAPNVLYFGGAASR